VQPAASPPASKPASKPAICIGFKSGHYSVYALCTGFQVVPLQPYKKNANLTHPHTPLKTHMAVNKNKKNHFPHNFFASPCACEQKITAERTGNTWKLAKGRPIDKDNDLQVPTQLRLARTECTARTKRKRRRNEADLPVTGVGQVGQAPLNLRYPITSMV